MPEYINYVATPTSCTPGNHAFYVYGDPPPDSLDGIPCQCGAMIASVKTCHTCGYKRFKEIPREEWEEEQAEPEVIWDTRLSRFVPIDKYDPEEQGGLVS